MTKVNDQNTASAATTAGADAAPAQQSINGQSAFHVELSPVGVVVRTVFVGEDSSLHAAPAAVFANLEMALHQLDELKRLVLRQFSEVAFVGMQALQQAPQASSNSTAEQSAADKAKELV